MAKADRVLALLEALQDHPFASGPQLARRLGVDERTLRRDVAALRSLGIPVEADRGRGGGYRLRPGYRMPPLLFSRRGDRGGAGPAGRAARRARRGERAGEAAARAAGPGAA